MREDLGHQPVQVAGDLLAPRDLTEERAGERRALDDGHPVAHGDGDDAAGHEARALGHHTGRPHGGGIVAQGHRDVDRIADHHVGALHLGHHAARGPLPVQRAQARLELGIALLLLALQAHLLLRHPEALLVLPPLVPVVEEGDHQVRDRDGEPQLAHDRRDGDEQALAVPGIEERPPGPAHGPDRDVDEHGELDRRLEPVDHSLGPEEPPSPDWDPRVTSGLHRPTTRRTASAGAARRSRPPRDSHERPGEVRDGRGGREEECEDSGDQLGRPPP